MHARDDDETGAHSLLHFFESTIERSLLLLCQVLSWRIWVTLVKNAPPITVEKLFSREVFFSGDDETAGGG